MPRLAVKEYFEKNINKVRIGQRFYLYFGFWKNGREIHTVTEIWKDVKRVYLTPENSSIWGGDSGFWNPTITVEPVQRRIGVFKPTTEVNDAH